jgi:molybdate transport repressor ModE-like protein
MGLEFTIRWALDGVDIEPVVFDLLEGIARHGALLPAARETGVSYRHAWGTLVALERALGQPLAILQRGRGARLSPLGATLLSGRADTHRAMATRMSSVRKATQTAIGRVRDPRPAPPRIHASHDLALVALREIGVGHGVDIDLQFRGSLEALESLASGRCDVAGFHVPDDPPLSAALAPYVHVLGRRGLQILPFVRRTQGLMVRRGNPRRVRAVADLARRGVRFVNRQEGSGTRLLLDRMLARARVESRRIAGYDRIEFTHAAVAATVASGMADAGFGVEAAARQHHLDFLPLVTERYFLAATPAAFRGPGVTAMLAITESPEFLAAVRALAGYSLLVPGTPQPARALLQGSGHGSGRIAADPERGGRPR